MTKDTHKLTIQLSSRAEVATLQEIAKRLGYIQPVGGGAGQGSISALMQAIARGEVEARRK